MNFPPLKVMLILLTGLISCKGSVPVPEHHKAIVDHVIYPHIALGANVGIITGLIHDGKKEIYSYGEAKLGKREPINSLSTLEIASLTKVFTALALADMVSKGEVKLDDKVEDFLPGIQLPSKEGEKLTFRNLANHTSGLPRLADNMDKNAYNPYKGYSDDSFFNYLSSCELSSVPGAKYGYSNIGYGLLGYTLAGINKSSYEGLISSRVLEPLQLKNTFVTISEMRQKNQVQGYNGNRQVDSWSKYQEASTQGAGSLSSSTEDLLKFLEANMWPERFPYLRNALELSQQKTFEVSGWKQDGVALGWETYHVGDHEIIWKNGQNGAYSAFIGFDKASKNGVVVLCNSSLNPDLIQSEIGFELLKKLNSW